jgi:hypothetical protein
LEIEFRQRWGFVGSSEHEDEDEDEHEHDEHEGFMLIPSDQDA